MKINPIDQLSNVVLLVMFLFGFAVSALSQEIKPYLQSPTTHSIWVTWKSSTPIQPIVRLGTNPDSLFTIYKGMTEQLGEDYFWHKVKLDKLTPQMAYYYQVENGKNTSKIFRFRTQPDWSTKEGHFRFLIIGDHQRYSDPKTNRRYERLVKAARRKVEQLYGGAIEDQINLVLNAGDQVDIGTLEQYEHLHFDQSSSISGNVPFMTVIGNHEYGADPQLKNYFAHFIYDDDALLYKQMQGEHGENYYAFQLGRALFVMLNSNQEWPEQVEWTKKVIRKADTDNTIDWVFSDCHHPIYAEQLPGDASAYMLEDILPVLMQTKKMSMYISGHAHLYARGAIDEMPLYHIINGGASWDQFWDASIRFKNFKTTQKTIERQIFQLVDIDLAREEMHVETWSIGTNLGAGFDEDRLIDRYYLKRTSPKPSRPSLKARPDTITLPFTFESSTYQGAEPYNSTAFQIAGPTANFKSPIYTEKRDFEDLFWSTGPPHYEPIDQNKGVDIFKFTAMPKHVQKGKNYIRVRHRDQSMKWSEWSEPIAFYSTNGYLQEPVFEKGKAQQSMNIQCASDAVQAVQGIYPFEDQKLFTANSQATLGGLPQGYDQGDFTFNAWIKFSDLLLDAEIINLGLTDVKEELHQWRIGFRGQQLFLSKNGKDVLLKATSIQTHEWLQLSMVKEDEQLSFFINGQKIGKDTTAKLSKTDVADFIRIGKNYMNGFSGHISSMQLWVRALDEAELLNNYRWKAEGKLLSMPLETDFISKGLVDVKQIQKEGGTFGEGHLHNGYLILPQMLDILLARKIITNHFSMNYWIKVDDPAATNQVLRMGNLNLQTNKGKLLLQSIQNGRGKKILKSKRRLKPDQWYHIAVTQQRGQLSLFINGMKEGEGHLRAGTQLNALERIIFGSENAYSSLSLARLELYNKPLEAGFFKRMARYNNQQPILHLPLETTLTDVSANAYDFSTHYEAKFSKRDENAYLTLDGKTSYPLFYGENSGEFPQKHISISTWVNLESLNSWGGYLGFMQDNGTQESGWVLGNIGKHFSIGLATEKHRSLNYLKAPDTIQLNQWYHLAATYDGEEVILYVDGEEVASSTQAKGRILYPAKSWLELGAYHDDNEYFTIKGGLSNIKLWGRRLTPGEIKKEAFGRKF